MGFLEPRASYSGLRSQKVDDFLGSQCLTESFFLTKPARVHSAKTDMNWQLTGTTWTMDLVSVKTIDLGSGWTVGYGLWNWSQTQTHGPWSGTGKTMDSGSCRSQTRTQVRLWAWSKLTE